MNANIRCCLISSLLLIIFILFEIPTSCAQFTGSSDRTQQELNLLDWTIGIRTAYCQATPIAELINPFKEAVARMVNRFCRNATACRLKKSVTFSKHQIVILDGYPRRENRALNFRFFVVFPHEAIPLDKKAEKPLLPQKALSDVLQTQLSELTHGLGWQVLSRERFPRFDPMTTFMNRAMIPILVIALLCMLFLAYWSSSITSGSSLYGGGGGWMVSGSTGGKNAALRRTLEIIAEQKLRFEAAAARRQSMHSSLNASGGPKTAFIVYKSNARLQASAAPPRSLATSSAVEHCATAHRAAPLLSHQAVAVKKGDKSLQPRSLATVAQEQDPSQQRRLAKVSSSSNGSSTETTSTMNSITRRRKSSTTTTTASSTGAAVTSRTPTGTSFPTATTPLTAGPGPSTSSGPSPPSAYRERLESMDVVPELVVMHSRNPSMDTTDTYGGRKVSIQGHRRHSRRFSVSDEFKRKKSVFGSGTSGGGGSRPKRWKTGSLMFSRFSFRRPK